MLSETGIKPWCDLLSDLLLFHKPFLNYSCLSSSCVSLLIRSLKIVFQRLYKNKMRVFTKLSDLMWLLASNQTGTLQISSVASTFETLSPPALERLFCSVLVNFREQEVQTVALLWEELDEESKDWQQGQGNQRLHEALPWDSSPLLPALLQVQVTWVLDTAQTEYLWKFTLCRIERREFLFEWDNLM